MDHNPTSQRKFYINPDAIVRHAKHTSAFGSSPQTHALPSLSAAELSDYVSSFGAKLKQDMKAFSASAWSLRHILSMIPSNLWTFMIWGLSSHRRKEAWLVRAGEVGIPPCDIYAKLWPVSFIPSALKPHSTSLFSLLAPADVVLIRRVRAILEQMALQKQTLLALYFSLQASVCMFQEQGSCMKR